MATSTPKQKARTALDIAVAAIVPFCADEEQVYELVGVVVSERIQDNVTKSTLATRYDETVATKKKKKRQESEDEEDNNSDESPKKKNKATPKKNVTPNKRNVTPNKKNVTPNKKVGWMNAVKEEPKTPQIGAKSANKMGSASDDPGEWFKSYTEMPGKSPAHLRSPGKKDSVARQINFKSFF